MATRPVDEKIVVMKLDNSNFKQKAAETTSLFGKLRSALDRIPGVNLNKTTNELGSIAKQTNSINMTGLANSIQNVANKFSGMNVVATTALATITSMATQAGVQLAKSLSLDQVTDGFREYETKIGAIGTVLANTEWAGTGLSDVKKTLEELNHYADDTIYNFSQMTENIGRFTAAGVTLEDSAIAIKGLSNLAAASGSNAEQLNTAMYQMSQALAAGKLNLMDWNSLVNAGMAGKKTQDALVATAKAMGKNVDLSDGFRNSIEKGWLTSEVFLETLKKFGKDKSMTEMATSVRTFTGLMSSLKEGIGSGWATTWELIFGDFEQATKFWTKMSKSIGGWFSDTAEARNKLIKGVADRGGIQNIFSGLQNAVKPISQIFQALGDGFRKVFPSKTAYEITQITKSFKDFTKGLSLSSDTMDKLTFIFRGLFSGFDAAFKIAKQLGTAISKIIPDGAGGGILDFLVTVSRMVMEFNQSISKGNILTATIDGLGNVMEVLGKGISATIGVLGAFGKSIVNNLGKAINWVKAQLEPFGKYLKETFGGGIGGDELVGAGVITMLVMFGTKMIGVINNILDLADGFGDSLEAVGDALQNFAMGIKITNLLLIAVAVGLLATSLKKLEDIKTENLIKGITALALSLGVMMGAMVLIDKFNIMGGVKASATLIALAAAVNIMASALKKLSDIDPEKLSSGISGLVVVTGALAAAVIAMSKWGGKIKVGSVQLLALAGSIYILASAVDKMSSIDTGSLFKSIGALTIIFAELAIFLKVIDRTKFGPGAAIGMLIVAGALNVMVSAIQKMDTVDVGGLVKGLSSIAIILGQIVIFSKLVKGPTLMMASAGLLAISVAINALVPPIRALGNMSMTELAKGLGAMAIALATIAGAAMLMNGTLLGSASMVVMAGALIMLLIPIKALANMTWGELLKGFVGLAGAMTLVAGASILLSPAVPLMLAFGAALAVMGVALMATGAGVALFATGLTALATLTAVSITAIISSMGLFLQGLAELIPGAVKFIVDLGLALSNGLRKLIPNLVQTAITIVMSLLKALAKNLPEFLKLGTTIVLQLMDGISKYVPKLVDSGVKMVISLIKGLSKAIRDNGPMFTSSVLELLGEILILFVQAGVQVINALFGWMPGVKKATSAIGTNAEKYIRENFKAKEAGQDKGKDFAKGLDGKKADASKAGKALATAGKTAASSVKMTDAGSNFGAGFANGISSKISSVMSAAKNMANAASNKIKEVLDIHSPSRVTTKSGEDTGQGFVNGISKKEKEAAAAAKRVAASAKKGFNEAMDKAEYKFKMEQINDKQYIAQIEKIKKSYSGYPALVRQANLEIKKIEEDAAKHREELRKKQEEAIRKRYEGEKALIENKKYYNQLSITEELAMYEALQKKYKVGTEQRKELDREVYRLKNELNKQLIAINDEYVAKVQDANKRLIEGEKALTAEYEKAVDDRTKALTGFAGIFDEIKQASDVTGQGLMDNLKGQVDTFIQWQSNLQALKDKGIDTGLLNELTQMGPQSASQIAALTTLTAEQLTEYSNLWKTKSNLARTEAIKELEGMKTDTATKIKELKEQSKIELDNLKKEWVAKIKEIKNGTTGEFVALKTSMKTIGTDAIKGMMNGMSDMTGPLLAQAKSIADSISATIKGALKIKSPSRVMMGLGEFATEGLAVGMGNKAGDVVSSAKNLAVTATDTLNKFLEGFELPQEDNELHFKAVIDYDKLDPSKFGTHSIDTSFANNSMSAVSAMKRQNGDNVRSVPTGNQTSGPNQTVINQELNFHSQQLTPSEVARKNLQASRDLALQWGV